MPDGTVRRLKKSTKKTKRDKAMEEALRLGSLAKKEHTAVLQSLRNTAAALGIEAGLIGRPEHPCRLPGERHAKTGGISRVLWLQESCAKHPDKT